MKTFRQFIAEMNDNDTAEIRRMYIKLKNQKSLDDMEKQKLKVLSSHPSIKALESE
jgi:hypothetical protein